MKNLKVRTGGLCAALCVFAGLAQAEPPHISTNTEKGLADHVHASDFSEGQIPENLQGLEVKDHEPGYWERIEWGLAIDGVLHGNTGNQEFESRTDGVYGLDLEALFPTFEHGSVYLKLEAGGGEGVDGRIGTFSGFNDHSWGEDDIQISELWYEHRWLDGHVRGRLGRIDLTTDFDTNAFANCEHEQFLSSGFINNLAIDFPDYSIGGMAWWEPTEKFSVGIGYQSNTEWEDVFHDGFGILEMGWHPQILGHQGNYRAYGWASAYGEVRDEENGEVVQDAFTNYGFGFSFDQEMTEHLGLWCRYGWKPNEAFNSLQTHTSLGVQVMNLAIRPDDAFGMAYGIATLADEYAASLTHSASERHLEFYYRVKLHELLSLTPNLQWVENPEGDADREDALVLGLRGTFLM